MNDLSGLMTEDSAVPDKFTWFFQAIWQPTVCTLQDPLHVLVKLYRRLVGHVLIIGSKIISVSFLQLLLKEDDRRYGICLSDLKNTDAMNVRIAEKVGSERIISGLEKNVPGSEALVVYLSLMMWVRKAYIDAETSPVTRVFLAWKLVFFVRIWKASLVEDDEKTLKHFISSNTYNCLELNAHSLLVFLTKCRDENRPDLFKVEKLGSQPCERYFATERSQTTTLSTITNFDMFDLLCRTKRTDIMLMAQSKCENFEFARLKQTTASTTQIDLPSENEINNVIENSFEEAKILAQSLGKCNFS